MAGVSGNNRLPKDAQVIVSMLKEAGINDFEPRVVNQLLEFTYRYVTGILDEARVYAQHAKKKTIDLEDVKLASLLQLDRSFTSPPPRDMLMEIAKTRNSGALPVIKPHYGLRLPPDRHCLSSCNYKLKSNKKNMKTSSMQMNASLLSSANRIGSNISNRNTNMSMKVTPGGTTGGMTMVSTLQPTTPLRSKIIQAPKSVMKFNTPTGVGAIGSPLPKIQISTGPSGVATSSIIPSASTPALIPTSSSMTPDLESGMLKRKREPDEAGFETGE